MAASGRAAEIDRDARPLHRLHRGGRALDSVIGALVVDRRLRRPNLLQHVHVFVGAGIAVILAQPVAITRLVHIVAARDDMDRRPAAAELVERGEGAGRIGGRLEPGPVRHQEADLPGVRGGMRRELQSVGPVAVPADQDAVEAPALRGMRLVRLGRGHQVAGVDRRAARSVDLRLLARLDHADELEAHPGSPFSPRAARPAAMCAGARHVAVRP